jgi:hypothetical protein
MFIDSIQSLPPAPRMVGISSRGRSMFAIVLLMPLFPASFIVPAMLQQYNRTVELVQDGIVTNATVCDKFITTGKTTSYYLVCKYTVDGQVDTANARVADAAYYGTPLGTSYPVTYLPQDPSRGVAGRVTGADLAKRRQAFAMFPVIFGGFVLVTEALLLLGYRIEKDLLCRGTGTLAVMTQSRLAPKGGGTRVDYTYTVNGETYTGSGVVPLGSVGASLPIVYDPARPSRSMALAAMTMARLRS